MPDEEEPGSGGPVLNPLRDDEDEADEPAGDATPGGAPSGGGPEPEFRVTGTALGILPEDSAVRSSLFKVLFSPAMDTTVLVLVAVSFAVMYMQLPSNAQDLDDDQKDLIGALDLAVLLIFTLECLGKVATLGFVRGDDCYLRSGWNALDFAVVLFSWLDVIAQSELPLFRLVRVLRCLRPLREQRLVKGLAAIVGFYGYILNVCLFMLFFMCIFGTIGVQLFGGTLSYRCVEDSGEMYLPGDAEPHDMHNETKVRCPHALGCRVPPGEPNAGALAAYPDDNWCIHVVIHGEGLLNQGGVGYLYSDDRTFETEIYGFDNIWSSFVTQFVAVTMDEWPAMAHPISESGGMNSRLVWPFFFVIIIILACVTANLFCSVICFAFGNIDTSAEDEEGRARVRKIHALFNRIDTDGGGTIDASEIGHLAEMIDVDLSPAEAEQAATEMDKNGNGHASFEEFVDWWDSSSVIATRLRRAIISEEALITASFERIDEDGSGTLDLDEVKALASTMGITLTPEELAEAIAGLKVSQDHVSFDAFSEWWLGGGTVAQKVIRSAKGEGEKLERMFAMLDSNGSGDVDESDFEESGAAAFGFTIGAGKAAAILKEMRAQSEQPKGSSVSFETFQQWWRSEQELSAEVRLAQQQDEADIRRMFERINALCVSGGDESAYGRLGEDELALMSRRLGLRRTAEQNRETLAEIDSHSDGQVEFPEFYLWLNKQSDFAQSVRSGISLLMAEDAQNPFPYIPGLSDACNAAVQTNAFDLTIMGIVLVNTGFMCLEHHDSAEWVHPTVRWSEAIFTVMYATEALMKIVGLGLGPYFAVNLNKMDFAIVCSSIAGFFVPAMSSIASFRVVRLVIKMLRVVRLASVFAHNDAMVLLLKTVIGSSGLLGQLFAFIFAFMCLMSMAAGHLLGPCHLTNETGQHVDSDGFPRQNFYYYSDSLLSNFQVMSGEDWAPMMYGYMNCAGYGAMAYFLFIVIVTNFFLLNIFVAVILENFDMSEEEKLIKQKSRFEEQKSSKQLSGEMATKYAEAVGEDGPSAKQVAKVVNKGMKIGDDESESPTAADGGEDDVVEKAMYLFSVDSGLRVTAIKLTTHAAFEIFTVLAIVVSSVVIAIEGPPDAKYLKGEDGVIALLEGLNYIVFFVFLFEMLLKIVANGFTGSNGAYWNNGWNRLDFIIVMISIVDVAMTLLDVEGHLFRAFRVLRVLRPLRMIQFSEGMKVVFTALLDCLPTVVAVVMLSFLFYITFAILGVGLFMGQFYRCDCGGDWGKPERNCTDPDWESLNMTACEAQGGAWENPPFNFDNIFDAMRTLFICSTTEGWVDIMNSGMDATPFELAPEQDINYGLAIYFVLFILIGTFFITNIFIGVLCNFFGEANGSLLLTDSQQQWLQTQELCLEVKPKVVQPPTGGVRKALYPLALSPMFGNVMNALIGVNVVILMAERVPVDRDTEVLFQTANVVLLCCFTVEMLVKIIALGPRNYWADNWNKLDGSTVVTSWIGEMVEGIGGVQALRAMRVIRLVMLLKHATTLRSLIGTLVKSLIPASNIFCLLVLVYFCYGVLGMYLYGELEYGEKITELDNFDNIFNAMKLLFQASTGQDFMNLMHELELKGGRFVFPYFCTYLIAAIWVFFNFFVAVVLENFERNFAATQMELSVWHVAEFKRVWHELTEPPEHGTLKATALVEFVPRLPAPLSTIVDEGPLWLNRVLFELGIDIVKDPDATVTFHDTLLALCLVSHSYEGLSYDQQQKKRDLIQGQVQNYAGRVLVLCTRTWLLSRQPPPEELGKRLQAKAGGQLDEAELQRKWQSALRGMRLLLLDSVVRSNKLGDREGLTKELV